MKEPEPDIIHGARNNIFEEVKAAIRKNPDCINIQDPRGMTALHWAGANANYYIVEFLFEQKKPPVDPWIKDIGGFHAVERAIETGFQEVIELFHHKMFPEDYDAEPPASKAAASNVINYSKPGPR